MGGGTPPVSTVGEALPFNVFWGRWIGGWIWRGQGYGCATRDSKPGYLETWKRCRLQRNNNNQISTPIGHESATDASASELSRDARYDTDGYFHIDLFIYVLVYLFIFAGVMHERRLPG